MSKGGPEAGDFYSGEMIGQEIPFLLGGDIFVKDEGGGKDEGLSSDEVRRIEEAFLRGTLDTENLSAEELAVVDGLKNRYCRGGE